MVMKAGNDLKGSGLGVFKNMSTNPDILLKKPRKIVKFYNYSQDHNIDPNSVPTRYECQ